MFKKVLIANRGEIAVRVAHTLREMGITSVAVFSDADVGTKHVRTADEAVLIGPAAAAESYLNISAVVEAALKVGAEAVHPGYGFLSENAEFAQACEAAGLVFIGPPVGAIESMGDKIAAKTKVSAAGVPVVPGRHDPDMTDEQVLAAVAEVGFPAMLKPSAGGGGKGMRVLRSGDDVAAAIVSARREAIRSFGDDTLLVERFIERPRHIEIQVLADNFGNVIHLGERECSLQRRHQKVVEEAPSPFVTPEVRSRMGAAAVDVARSCHYTGAGTVEFIVSNSDPDEFFFLEMNTRLQVEHPVTELVTGIDLVREQLLVAAGEPLRFGQDDVQLAGHAIEVRVYAEDPYSGFLPSAGELLLVVEPDSARPSATPPLVHDSVVHDSRSVDRHGDHATLVRVDSGVATGDVVGTDYDPMLAKIIGFADTRGEALDVLDQALAGTAYLGLTTNVSYLRSLLAREDVRAGQLHTGLLDEISQLTESGSEVDSSPLNLAGSELAAAGLERLAWLASAGAADQTWRKHRPDDDPWQRSDGWRLGEDVWVGTVLKSNVGEAVEVLTRGTPDRAEVRVGGGGVQTATVAVRGSKLVVQIAGELAEYRFARRANEIWLAARGRVVRYTEIDRLDADSDQGTGDGLGAISSPMPGTVIAVLVEPGDRAGEGQPLVTVEAMKMEHSLVAPSDAEVSEVLVVVGQQVGMGEELIRLADPSEADPESVATLQAATPAAPTLQEGRKQ